MGLGTREYRRRVSVSSPVVAVVRGVEQLHVLLFSAIRYLETTLSHILVCAVPNPGHVGPMLAVAQHLKGVGHDVTLNTSDVFRDRIESAGIRFVPLTGKANYDYRHMADGCMDLSAEDQKLFVLESLFAGTIPDQHEGIQRILRDTPADAILVDTFFLGLFPMLLGPKRKRPPVIGCGVNPMILSSRDCGLLLPPTDTPEGRAQIAEDNERVRRTFQGANDRINQILRQYGVPLMPHFFIDCVYLLPDIFLQFTAEALEFPRSDMPDTIHYVGPMLPSRSKVFEEPAWWKELDGSRPVVLVTQGTLANHDFNELIQPALRGLENDNVMVIVAAGRSDTSALEVPENARVASFIPFDRILPKTDVLVTNGGYGAVNHAFSLGVPIVVAGETEDKDMVAARVGWTGAGINLKTRYASADEVRDAVRTILSNEKYRNEAQRLQASFARHNALDALTRTVQTMITSGVKMSEFDPESVYAQ